MMPATSVPWPAGLSRRSSPSRSGCRGRPPDARSSNGTFGAMPVSRIAMRMPSPAGPSRGSSRIVDRQRLVVAAPALGARDEDVVERRALRRDPADLLYQRQQPVVGGVVQRQAQARHGFGLPPARRRRVVARPAASAILPFARRLRVDEQAAGPVHEPVAGTAAARDARVVQDGLVPRLAVPVDGVRVVSVVHLAPRCGWECPGPRGQRTVSTPARRAPCVRSRYVGHKRVRQTEQ